MKFRKQVILRWFGVAGVLAAVLTGCIAVDLIDGGDNIGFNHKHHLTDVGLECADCHEGALTTAVASLPARDVCTDCHDPDDPEDKFLRFWPDPDVSPFSDVVRISTAVVDFSHVRHIDAGVNCTDCHGDVASRETVTRAFSPTVDKCVACHNERVPELEIVVVDKEHLPLDHQVDWLRLHGEQVKYSPSASASSCAMCHEENYCSDCHQNEPPEFHTPFWKQRGHGLFVRTDRSRCETCHTTDSCVACHDETAPRSHRAGWGGSRSRHCVGCHRPLAQQQGCNVCHEGTPSHQLASPKPGWHTNGMNCRQCHGIGQAEAMPHVDNGDNCNDCHQ